MSEPTDFTKAVISIIKKIPKGRIATYSQIARLAGKPHGTRGVVWILHSSASKADLPWHRVINSKGKISFPPMSELFLRQRRLLELEDIRFNGVDVIDLEIYQWKKGIT